MSAPAGPDLVVRPIDDGRHLAFLESLPTASFLQTPAWGRVKTEWRAESIGWFEGDALVGAALVLHRRLPRLRRSLAYLPEGPVIDWADDLRRWLAPMSQHLAAAGAFGIRMGPPVVTRRWQAATVKRALADPALSRLGDVPADASEATGLRVAEQLRAAGWRQQVGEGGFTTGQPQYVFQLPLRRPDGQQRDEEDLLKDMNQLWRRNIKKAAKSGVTVRTGDRADLPAFHALYAETATRDEFTPRPLAYFQTMWDALSAERPERLALYLAEHEGDLLAATTLVRVGRHAWYSYGASSTAKREVRGSNAVQWQMMRDSLAGGADVYDLRGITETLDDSDPHVGLVTFKVGTGGEAVEYAGEWDLPLSRPLYAAFDLYMRRRRRVPV